MEDSAPKPMSTSIDVFLNHRPNFQDSLGNWHILYPSVATEREGKAGRPSGDGVVLSAGRNVVKEEMERTQEPSWHCGECEVHSSQLSGLEHLHTARHAPFEGDRGA